MLDSGRSKRSPTPAGSALFIVLDRAAVLATAQKAATAG